MKIVYVCHATKVVLLSFIVLISGCVSQTSQTTTGPVEAADSAIITITNSGFSPAEMTIRQGGTVTFVNIDSTPAWPASAIHPTHTVYPGSDINKCGTAEQVGIFDSCRGLEQNEEWSFTFDVAGTWRYHDHINPLHFGVINVV